MATTAETNKMKNISPEMIFVIKILNQEGIPAALFNHWALAYHGVNISAASHELVIPDDKMENAIECLLKNEWIVPDRPYPCQRYNWMDEVYVGGFKEATSYIRFFDYAGNEFQPNGDELDLYPASFVNMVGFDQDPDFVRDKCHSSGYVYIPSGRRLCLALMQLVQLCTIFNDYNPWHMDLYNGIRQCTAVYNIGGPQLPENEFEDDDLPPAVRKPFDDIWEGERAMQKIRIESANRPIPKTPEEHEEFTNQILEKIDRMIKGAESSRSLNTKT